MKFLRVCKVRCKHCGDVLGKEYTHSNQREGNVVEDWDISRLQIGEAIIGLPGYEPFIFKFDEYKKKN